MPSVPKLRGTVVCVAVVCGLTTMCVTAIEVHQAAPMRVAPAPAAPRVVESSAPDIVRGPGERGAGAAGAAQEAEIPAALFGRVWRLHVPGAAYQTENRSEGTRTLHVAPGSGTLAHEVRIGRNGAYVWEANGKRMTGRWARGMKRGYALTLLRGYEGKDWHATITNGELLLWDGSSLAGQFRGR